MTQRSLVGGLVGALVLAAASLGQPQDKSKYYTVAHAEEFEIDWAGFYDQADRMTAEVRQKLPHHLDLPYGSHPKQKLDVYLPPEKPDSAPVLVFVHGGGWREGDRAHYGYVAAPLAKRAIVTVVASYRLLPEFKFPEQPGDVRRILSWVFRNIESYGGDPGRIYLAGHSAGAILTADVCLKRDWLAPMSLPSTVPAGCIPISGSYDLRREIGAPDYVGDPARSAEASPILNIDDATPPVIVAVGTDERHLGPSRELAERLGEKGATVQLVELEGMDHRETVEALADERSALFQAILDLMEPSS